ncbi:extracellular solute-binding protein [Acidothermaceae bacterium B102]|nr:extracellular solute-binding protein [Acidothermaceae bacterium B102]
MGLTIWTDALKAPVIQKFATEFGAANGIKVAVQSVATNLQTAYVTATNAGKGPDVVAGANDWIGNLVQNGTIEPLNLPAATASSFLPIAIKNVTYNGQIYGVPYDVENLALFYNTDLVKTPPTTIEELQAQGSALLKAGKVKEILDLPADGGTAGSGDPYNAEPLYTSAGGYMFGVQANGAYDPSDLGLSKPVAATAYQKIQGLAKAGVLKTSINDNNVISRFSEGDAAFLQSGPWATAQIGKKVPFKVVPMVGFAGGTARAFVGSQAFYVSAKSKNKSFAEEFVENFLTKPAVAAALYQNNPLPSALTAQYNAEVAADPNTAGFGGGAKVGDPLPSIPAMAAVWTPLGIAEFNILSGHDPVSTIAAAATTIKAAIGKQ